MKLLLDTHAVLWWLADDERLSEPARTAITRAGVEAAVSAASVWESAIKRAAGKLEAPDLLASTRLAGFPVLAMTGEHAKLAGELPLLHRDPFDRMLVAQAMLEQLTVVTRDKNIPRYGVASLW